DEGKGGADHEGDTGREQHHDQAILKAGLEVAIAHRLVEPAQRQLLRWEGEEGLVIERGDADDDRRQNDKAKDRDDRRAAGPTHHAVREWFCHLSATRLFPSAGASAASRRSTDRSAADRRRTGRLRTGN